MLEVLTQPVRFFESLRGRKPDLLPPLLVVVAALALSAVASQVSARLLPAVFPGGAGLQLAFALAGALVFGLILWAVGAGPARHRRGGGAQPGLAGLEPALGRTGLR